MTTTIDSDFVNDFGVENDVSFYIDNKKIDGYPKDGYIEERLNEMNTLEMTFYSTGDNIDLLVEKKKLYVFTDRGTEPLVFELTDVDKKSDYKIKVKGKQAGFKQLQSLQTERTTYTKQAADNILTSEIASSEISYGTIESAPVTSIRTDYDNKLRLAIGLANQVEYEVYTSRKESDDWQNSYLNFVDHKGSESPVTTLDIGGNAEKVDRNKDGDIVANDLTALGYGDGINQIKARVFEAGPYTVLTQELDEGDTSTFTVEDTSVFGSSGDNLTVRVGSEVVDCDIVDGTTLSINYRGLNNYEGDSTEEIDHFENVLVFLRENVTQGDGLYKPNETDASPDSSISKYGLEQATPQDKEIVSKTALEKFACNELAARREPPFRIQVKLTDPTIDPVLGDSVLVEDLQAMDTSQEFRILGIERKLGLGEEEKIYHCSNLPKKLIQKLKELSRQSDAESRHMQGATNIDSQNFADNCDTTNPLNTKFYVPEDAVEINKINLVFNRESFRGYVQNSSHDHTITVNHPTHNHTVDVVHPSHNHDVNISDTASTQEVGEQETGHIAIPPREENYSIEHNSSEMGDIFLEVPDSRGGTTTAVLITIEIANNGDSSGSFTYDLYNKTTDTYLLEDQTYALLSKESKTIKHTIPTNQLDVGETVEYQPVGGTFDHTDTTDVTTKHSYVSLSAKPSTEHDHDISDSTTSTDALGTTSSETSSDELGTTTSETSDNAGNPIYGLYEPTSEPLVDLEVYVDGNLVDTVSDVGVGYEKSIPMDLSSNLSTPIPGKYHDIKLKPIDTGGGNNGRSRINATVYQKIFVQSAQLDVEGEGGGSRT